MRIFNRGNVSRTAGVEKYSPHLVKVCRNGSSPWNEIKRNEIYYCLCAVLFSGSN